MEPAAVRSVLRSTRSGSAKCYFLAAAVAAYSSGGPDDNATFGRLRFLRGDWRFGI